MRLAKILSASALLAVCAFTVRAQGTVQMQCRHLRNDGSDFLLPNEAYVNGVACHVVKADPVDPAPAAKATVAKNSDPQPAPKAASAPDPADPNVKRDDHLAWIDPASPYASYIEAAAQKKHVRVEFTTKKAYAGLFVTVSDQGSYAGSTWRAIMLKNSGQNSSLSMTVSDAETGAVMFSYACHKGGTSFIATGHEDFQSAAECLAKHWAERTK